MYRLVNQLFGRSSQVFGKSSELFGRSFFFTTSLKVHLKTCRILKSIRWKQPQMLWWKLGVADNIGGNVVEKSICCVYTCSCQRSRLRSANLKMRGMLNFKLQLWDIVLGWSLRYSSWGRMIFQRPAGIWDWEKPLNGFVHIAVLVVCKDVSITRTFAHLLHKCNAHLLHICI